MNGAAETKVCRQCAETIKAAARFCPFCQHPQSRFILSYTGRWYLCAGLVMISCLIGWAVWLSQEIEPSRRDFNAHRKDLEVYNATVGIARQTPEMWENRLNTNIIEMQTLFPPTTGMPVGFRAGTSPIPSTVDVRFLDSQGNLLGENPPEPEVTVAPCIWLTGFVTNKGATPWYVHEFEVRVFDVRSNLADTQHVFPGRPFRVNPRQERAFRAALDELSLTNAIAGCSVRVEEAIDARDEPF